MPRPARRSWDDEDDRPVRRRKKSAGGGLLVALAAGGGIVLLLGCAGLGVGVWFLAGRGEPKGAGAGGPPTGAADAGVRVRAAAPAEAAWQRLTPATHPVSLLAPGTPQPADELKLRMLRTAGVQGFHQSQAWQSRGADGTVYFLLQVTRSGNAGRAGAKPEAELGTAYIANGGPHESRGPVTVDGLPGEEFGPQRGWPLNFVFVFRSVSVGNRIYVFGTNSKPDDPNVQRFFASVKIARAADGGLPGPAAGSPVGMPGLTAYLSFDADPAGGGPAMDAVSGRPVGTPVGRVARAPGVRGQALDLTRGGSFRLTGLESATTAKPGRPFTVALWVKTTAANGSVFYASSPQKQPPPSPAHLELGLMPWYARPQDNLQQVFVRRVPSRADKASEEDIAFQTTVAGAWTHLAFTRDAAGTATLYVNGERRPQNVRQGLVGTLGGPDAYLGGLSVVQWEAYKLPDPKLTDRTPFAGLIDELALFDAALTTEQVRKLAGE